MFQKYLEEAKFLLLQMKFGLFSQNDAKINLGILV